MNKRAPRTLQVDPREPSAIRLISQTEVCKRIDRSRWWLRDQILAGKFPKPVPDVGRFVESEVDDWLRAKMAER